MTAPALGSAAFTAALSRPNKLSVQKSWSGNMECLPKYEPNASPHFSKLLPQHGYLVFYCFDLQRPGVFAGPV
jgi:hypothetical protein